MTNLSLIMIAGLLAAASFSAVMAFNSYQLSQTPQVTVSFTTSGNLHSLRDTQFCADYPKSPFCPH